MEAFVSALRSAIAAGAWHSALALALALPDICARVETPKVKSGIRYPRWWIDNVQHAYEGEGHIYLSGDDAYALRCAFLHEGQHDIVEQSARKALDRFQFTQPLGITCVQVGAVLQLDIQIFCTDVADAVDAWIAARRSAGQPFEPENVLVVPKNTRIGSVQIG